MVDDLAERVRSLRLDYRLEQYLENEVPALEQWTVTAMYPDRDDRDADGEPTMECVALLHLVKGSLIDAGLWDQLDAVSVDLEIVGSALLDRDNSELKDSLLEKLMGAGSALLILDRVAVSTSWRGHGIGVMLAGIAIQTLEGHAACVATYPAPIDGSEGTARAESAAKLESVWAQLGFEHFANGVWVLDPSSAELGDAVTQMKWRFGLD